MSWTPRLFHCARTPIAIADHVDVVMGAQGAYLTNVQSCGSVWACPVCSAVRREAHSRWIEAWSTLALRLGWEIDFVVLTIPHGLEDALKPLLAAMSKAWSTVTTSWGWTKVIKPVGFIRSWEVTDGFPNGWHPHLNALVVFEGDRTEAQRQAFSEYVSRTWADAIERELGRRPSDEHGVRVKLVTLGSDGRADVGAYISKVQDGFDQEGETPSPDWGIGREIARGDVKNGRRASRWSPFALAKRAAAGEAWAKERWHEYERATFGGRCVEESRAPRWRSFIDGLAVAAGYEARKPWEEACRAGAQLEIDTEPAVGVEVYRLTLTDWQLVARYARQWELLKAADARGAAGCDRVMETLRKRQRLDDKAALRRLIPVVDARELASV